MRWPEKDMNTLEYFAAESTTKKIIFITLRLGREAVQLVSNLSQKFDESQDGVLEPQSLKRRNLVRILELTREKKEIVETT
jgi:aspartyl/asparaginyl-tRNA synthetase